MTALKNVNLSYIFWSQLRLIFKEQPRTLHFLYDMRKSRMTAEGNVFLREQNTELLVAARVSFSRFRNYKQ